jgi:L-threonate 2-dehydrogenase
VTTVGMVGLGIMGSAMSRHLLAAGHGVLGFDVDAERLRELERAGGTVVSSPAAAAGPGEVLITSLSSGQAALDVCTELAAGAPEGLVVVETSTLPHEVKDRCRELVGRAGAELLDCPLSGTGAQARVRDVVVYGSGDEAAFERARPVLSSFARSVRYLGPFGAGSTMKLIANLLVAVHNAAAAEALLLAQRAGLDLEDVLTAVGDGAGGSRMLQVRGPLMAAGRYAPATATVATMQKDNALIAAFARGVASPTPLFSATTVLYQAAVAQDRLQEDTACVFGVLQRLAGQ